MKQEFQIGDIVYCVDEDYKGFEDRVVEICLEANGCISYTCDDGWCFFKEDIGKEVFRSKEDRAKFLSK